MAVAIGTGTPTRSMTPGTGTTVTSASWTISGSNLVIILHLGFQNDPGTISTVSWSLGGSGTLVKSQSGSTGSPGDGFAYIYVIKPTSGSGTYTVTWTNSTAYQISADYFTGADQTTPCPTGDAWSSNAVTASVASSVTNLTANDACAGLHINTLAGNPNSVTPNQTYLDNTTAINLETGYATGTTQVTTVNDDGTNHAKARIAVRIVAASTGNSSSVSPSVSPSSSVSPSVSLSPSPSASLSPSSSQSPSASASPSIAGTVYIERTVFTYID